MATRILSQKELNVKKIFEKCGLEEIAIDSATMGTMKSLYIVNNPVLYRIKNSNSYLLYGDPMDYSSILEQLKESAKDPEKFKKMMEERMQQEEETVIDGENTVEETEEEALNEDDINLIVSEVKISREEAIRALKEANDDVIQALVNLNKK